MVTALRYLGYYWLIVTALILAAYDRLALKRLPEGIEWLQVALLSPGFILVAIGCRRGPNNVDAADHAPARAAPSFRFDDSASDRVGTFGEQGKRHARDSGRAAMPRHRAQTRNLSMEMAADNLIESVMKNTVPLRRAALLMAEKDGAVADALSRILEASETVGNLRADDQT